MIDLLLLPTLSMLAALCTGVYVLSRFRPQRGY